MTMFGFENLISKICCGLYVGIKFWNCIRFSFI